MFRMIVTGVEGELVVDSRPKSARPAARPPCWPAEPTRSIDNLTELTYYTVQMCRMAAGTDPVPDCHAAIVVVHYLIASDVGSTAHHVGETAPAGQSVRAVTMPKPAMYSRIGR